MTTYHTAIRYVAIVLAVINLASCFTLDLREWLVYFDPWFVVAIVCPAFVVGLPSLPFLLPVREWKSSLTKILSLIFTSMILFVFEVFWFLMIAIATFFRGPDWNFYWPSEARVPKIVPMNNFDLSEWVWIYCLQQPLPENPLIRESIGIILILLYLVAIPLIVCWLVRRFTVLPFWRLLTFVMIVQLLSAFPLKVLLRFANLRYVVAFPEQLINI